MQLSKRNPMCFLNAITIMSTQLTMCVMLICHVTAAHLSHQHVDSYNSKVHKKAHMPRDSMTVEYGGHNGYQREALKHWENIMLKYKDYFADDEKYGTNEKLGFGTTPNLKVAEITGLSGSFQKLNVN